MEASIARGAASDLPAQHGGDGAPPSTGEPQKKSFPSARDTAVRRSRMAAFIRGMGGVSGAAGIAEACRRMVKKWFDMHRRLLI